MKQITIPEEMQTKLINGVLKIDNFVWIKTIFFYLVDHRRVGYQKELSRVVKEDLENPCPKLKELAVKFSKIKNFDDRIVLIRNWVFENITYKSDKYVYNTLEYWATMEEILEKKMGDCDDKNRLIRAIARLSGINDFLLYNCIGDVYNPIMENNKEGHYWLVYLSPSTGFLYSIDSTYKVTKIELTDMQTFRLDSKNYISIWYLWNELAVYKMR